MSEVNALTLVELAVFLTLARLLALGVVLVGLELATNMGQVVVASIVAFHCHDGCCPFFLEFD